MVLYNYSSLQNRETKIYNIGGYNLSGGFSVDFLKIVGPATVVGIILGIILGLPFGIRFIPFIGGKFIPAWTIAWIGIGAGIGCALWYVQFAGYRLYQYLAAYFKPKKVYMNDFKHTEIKLTNIKIDTLVKTLF